MARILKSKGHRRTERFYVRVRFRFKVRFRFSFRVRFRVRFRFRFRVRFRVIVRVRVRHSYDINMTACQKECQ